MAEDTKPTPSSEIDDPQVEKGESQAFIRPDTGLLGSVLFVLGIIVSLGHVYLNTWGTLAELRFAALHFAGFGLICALAYPMVHAPVGTPKYRLILGVDIVLGLLVIACALYLIGFEDALYKRGQNFSTADWIFSGLAVLLAMEFTRRTTGWLIPAMIIISLSYVVWWGALVDGVFHFPGLTAETVLYRSFFVTDGMFGPIARISYSYVAMFILFGAFLLRSGAGDFIIDLAKCAAGKIAGGPGIVAVLGSGLMGSISGSAVANTVSTGVITIPLMKRAGYKPKFAAGVEAAASTGGQLMPPIMGAGAFVMQNLTQISYLTIIGVSVLPAIVYFFSVAAYVRIEAKVKGLKPLEVEGPKLGEVLKGGWHFLLPLAVLVALLVNGFTPTYAAGISILAVVGASWLSKKRMGPRAILEALALGARNCASLAVLLVAVGLVVQVIATTGIGNIFSLMIQDWAGGSLVITLILVALASLVLGMGLPVTASYIILATLSAPAINQLMVERELVEMLVAGTIPADVITTVSLLLPDLAAQLGGPMTAAEARELLANLPPEFRSLIVDQSLDAALLASLLLASHLIIFWLSQDSNVTPPVALCAFAAGAIAGTKPMETGFQSWKVAKGLYILPFLFAYTSFIGGTPAEVAEIFIFSMLGVYAFAGAFQGGLEGPIPWYGRLALLVATALFLWPHGNILVHASGLVILLPLIWLSIRTGKRGGASLGAASASS